MNKMRDEKEIKHKIVFLRESSFLKKRLEKVVE